MRACSRRPLQAAAVLGAVLLAPVATAGCTGYSGTQANQVSQWASQYAVVSNDRTVISDIMAIRRSLQAKRLKDVTSNCSGLVYDTGTAYGDLPTPDNVLTNELNVAYQDFASGGSTCAAAGSLHSSRITSALTTIGEGVVALDKATRLLAADGVR
ncbi:MAG: hypothetical protein ACLQCU_15945 [Acidimicrobiales bacterium]